MKSLFVRMYLVIGFVLVCGLVALYYLALDSYAKEAARDELRYVARVHLYVLEKVKNLSSGQYQAVIDEWQPYISYDLTLLDVDTLANDKKKKLLLGEPVAEVIYANAFETVDVSWLLPGKEKVIVYSRYYDTQHSDETINRVLLLILLVAFPLTILFLLRPITRSLLTISEHLHHYAEGDLAHNAVIQGPHAFRKVGEDLQSMADSLRRKIQEQMVMTHAISHELKTPLTRLRMDNDLAKMAKTELALRQYVESAEEDINLLEKLINNILTLAKYTHQQHQLPLSKLNLSAYLNQVLEALPAHNKQINVTLDSELEVFANPEGLSHILFNLLNNAIRYADRKILISGYSQERCSELVVEDDGPGIPEAERAAVFLPFSRVDNSRSRETGGTGLGLAIVAIILERSQAKLNVSESRMGGAKFTLVFNDEVNS